MDASTASVVVATITVVGGLGTKIAADLVRIKKQVTPSNGMATANILEKLVADMDEQREITEAHRNTTRREFRELKDDITYHIQVQHGRGPVMDEEDL